MELPTVPSGLEELDEVLQGLRLGDNVVWQVDDLADYLYFVRPFVDRSLKEGRHVVYLRFAPHEPVLEALPGLEIIELDPGPGFDYFSREVHEIIEQRGLEAFYVFDNLSALAVEWATDELLANFFQVTCPYLFELETVTYFALTRGQHAHQAVARIRDTTQILIDVYRTEGRMYIHPIKVWDRYSPQMFMPHLVAEGDWDPVFQSGEAAAVTGSARRPLLPAGSSAPWESVYSKLSQYRAQGLLPDKTDPEFGALKQELCRMLIGAHPEFSRLADEYLTLDDLFGIRDRLIGSGRIGGKAAGMLVARRILLDAAFEAGAEISFAEVLEPHDSFYIGSDVFFTFLVNNDLFRMRLQLSRNASFSRDEFEEVERLFLAGKFSPAIQEQFRNLLDYFGQAPIIVRSSSLLEDSFGNAFAGKYHSEFCANQGDPEQRLEAFCNAVKLVYASALNPDALSYRRKRGLGESDEQMAILVQRVSGMPYKQAFFPSVAGVAFSKNLYAWSDRIDASQGMVRLVFGLGTRAVDRVGGDYPRMIAISHPELRPEVGTEVAKYSQRQVDLLDLAENRLLTRPSAEVLEGSNYPNLYLLASVLADGFVQDPATNWLDAPSNQLVLTFNNLIRRTPFVKIMGAMLARLEAAYGHAVDTEFTASISRAGQVRFNLLQCRPLWLPGLAGPVTESVEAPAERTLFRSDRMVSGGVVKGIHHIVYIDPKWYDSIESLEVKKSLGRLVGRLNAHPRISAGKLMMMGPGRWGSSNISLGVNVGYADIHNAAVLVELAREEAGHVPEVSYGTHFFQDLVEGQIIYLPVYPDDPDCTFNEAFFTSAPNALLELLPDAGEYEQLVKVIDLTAQSGAGATVVADPQARKAVCYF